MPVPRPLPFLLSALFTIGLWVYGALIFQTDGLIQGGYATLVCGDAYSDPELRERLDSRGLTGLVSESDQWFLLDCFGSVEKIPLVDYSQRLLPFDPRNDGYAEKLKSVFVRDGKRFVYIPLGINRPENLETEIAQALTGISYSLEYAKSPPKRDIFFPLTAFFLTACAFFVIPVLRRQLNSGLLPCLPALSPLALGAAPGFALAALLAGFAALLAEPGQKLPPSPVWQRALPYDPPVPFSAKWLLAAALIACYGCFSFFSGLPVLFVFSVLASFCCLLLVSIRSGGGKLSMRFTVNQWSTRRGHFIPVEIISRKTVSYSFFPAMLPFAVMALALAFAGLARPYTPWPLSHAVNISPPPFMAPPSMAPTPMALPPGVITEADFQEHYLFQSAFSFRALGKNNEDGGLPPVITGYELSSNGLLDPVAPPGVNEEIQIPDFPLGDLLRGISPDASPRAKDTGNHGNSAPVAPQPGSKGVESEVRGSPLDLFLALPPMIFILPALLYSIKKKRQSGFSLLNNR
jgi:hypothetical protein